MSSKPVPDLPLAGPLTGAELVHVVQDGSSRHASVTDVANGGGIFYHYGSFAVAAITGGEVLMDHIAATAHQLAANLAGCVASVEVAPAAPWVADIRHNGVSIGSLTISVAGLVTWPAIAAVAVAAGDVVSLIAPAVADASIGRLRFTLKGAI